MSTLAFTDPMEAPPPAGALDRFFLKLIRDPRDLPFARVQLLNLTVMLGLVIWLVARVALH